MCWHGSQLFTYDAISPKMLGQKFGPRWGMCGSHVPVAQLVVKRLQGSDSSRPRQHNGQPDLLPHIQLALPPHMLYCTASDSHSSKDDLLMIGFPARYFATSRNGSSKSFRHDASSSSSYFTHTESPSSLLYWDEMSDRGQMQNERLSQKHNGSEKECWAWGHH